jgi:hypothetical protein
MPWKIVNLDYAADRPHLHVKDPNAPIHLRTFFDDKLVEIGLGDEEPDACFVRATVSRDQVVVKATTFKAVHVQILLTIFSALDVEPEDRDDALSWMKALLTDAQAKADREGFLRGNVASFPPPTGWPYDLTDEALAESLRDSGMPITRAKALQREAVRRGFRVDRRSSREPEISRRR